MYYLGHCLSVGNYEFGGRVTKFGRHGWRVAECPTASSVVLRVQWKTVCPGCRCGLERGCNSSGGTRWCCCGRIECYYTLNESRLLLDRLSLFALFLILFLDLRLSCLSIWQKRLSLVKYESFGSILLLLRRDSRRLQVCLPTFVNKKKSIVARERPLVVTKSLQTSLKGE